MRTEAVKRDNDSLFMLHSADAKSFARSLSEANWNHWQATDVRRCTASSRWRSCWVLDGALKGCWVVAHLV